MGTRQGWLVDPRVPYELTAKKPFDVSTAGCLVVYVVVLLCLLLTITYHYHFCAFFCRRCATIALVKFKHVVIDSCNSQSAEVGKFAVAQDIRQPVYDMLRSDLQCIHVGEVIRIHVARYSKRVKSEIVISCHFARPAVPGPASKPLFDAVFVLYS